MDDTTPEPWENSPPGWPQNWALVAGGNVRSGGRPLAQWSRLDEADRSDDLTTDAGGAP